MLYIYLFFPEMLFVWTFFSKAIIFLCLSAAVSYNLLYIPG